MKNSMYRTLLEAFNEDCHMITAQFKNLVPGAEEHMLPLHFDAALGRFRRMLADAVALERAGATEGASASS